MTAVCSNADRHKPHMCFYGWPRQHGLCDGDPDSADVLAQELIQRVRQDLLGELTAYLEGAREVLILEDRWVAGYRNALTDVEQHVQLLRRGETGGR